MKHFSKVIDVVLVVILILLIVVTSINSYVMDINSDKIIKASSTKDKDDYVVIVLGAAVYKDSVSMMLKDRLDMTLNIYNASYNKILVSGDSRSKSYNETSPMYNYLIDYGVEVDDIVVDSNGLSTYDSIWRAKYVYGYDKIIIVTQKYHLYRALYIADKLGIDAYGVTAEEIKYKGQELREIREILARVKDYFKVMFNSKFKHTE